MATAAIGTAVSLGISALSGSLTPSKNIFNETQVGKLENVSTRKTGAGWSLGKVYGRVQIQGCPIFWAPVRREDVVTTTETSRSGGNKFGGGQTTTNSTQTYKYYGTFAFAICDGAAEISVRQVKFNDKIWFNRDGQLDGTIADNDYKLENYLKIYTGASNQNIDPTIQSFEGNQNGDRNFRHLVYAVVTDFPLDEFGGELPSSIDCIVERLNGNSNRIDQVINEVVQTVGLTPGVDVITSALTNSDNDGAVDLRINAIFKQDGGTAADFINEIVQRHFLLTYLDDNGAINFELPENTTGSVTGNWGKLGAVEYGNEPSDPYSEIMPDESELPSSVTLSFSNLSDDFNGDNEIINYPLASHYNPKTISSQLYLMPDEAKWWVWKYLQFAWDQARRFTINLLPEDAVLLTESYRYNVPLSDGGTAIPFQIASIVIGANLTGEVELYQFNGDVYSAQPKVSTQTNVAYNGGTIQLTPNIVNTPVITNPDGSITYTEGDDYTVNLTTGVITIPPGSAITNGDDLTIIYIADTDFTLDSYNPNSELPDYGEPVITIVETNRIRLTDNPCIYAAIARDGDGFGQTIIYSRVNGGSYAAITQTLTPTTQGTLDGTLANASGLDTVNTATVVLTEGSLEPLSQNQFDNQEVILLIGDEQIVARDVVLVSANTYELSHIQRGVNGTIPASHADGETVYMAKGGIGSLLVLASDSSAIEQNFDFKAVPFNSDLATVTTVTNYTVQGIYFKPYQVGGVTSTKDSAGNITINWTVNDTGSQSLIPQSFEIDIYDGVTIVRTLTSNEPTVKYLASDQVIDFGSTQSTINIDIYQLSNEFGRGYVRNSSLSPILSNPLPTVLGFSPTQGSIGDAITIYGTGFSSATSASIAGFSVDDFTVSSDSVITGTVSPGTTTGKVSVTNATGTAESLTDFVITTGSVNFADIQGDPYTNANLTEILDRSWKYTLTVTEINIPAVGNTVNVTVGDGRYYIPGNFPIIVSIGDTFSQWNLVAKNGNVLTLERTPQSTNNASFFPSGSYLYPAIEVNQVYNIVSDLGLDVVNARLADAESDIGSLETAVSNLSNTFGSVYIASPTDTTIIKIPAARGYTINSLKGVAVDSGTCTLAIKINGVAVTGLGSIAVTTTPQNINATAANIVADGDLLTYEFSSVSSAAGFRGSLYVSI